MKVSIQVLILRYVEPEFGIPNKLRVLLRS
jgi:hypothetical protein